MSPEMTKIVTFKPLLCGQEFKTRIYKGRRGVFLSLLWHDVCFITGVITQRKGVKCAIKTLLSGGIVDITLS